MKSYAIIAMALLVLSVMPLVLATDVGTGVGVSINTERFAPRIWACDDRVLTDDNVENGANGLSLAERNNNYAFEGEQIHWDVLVMDKNKIEEVQDVVGTIGATQGVGNDIEVECKRVTGLATIPASCNARILEEKLVTFNPNTMAYYDCTFTVETPASMHGEYFITVEVRSVDGEAIMDENEYWFLNPTIALSVDGDLSFDDVRPGTQAYSQTLLVGNDAEAGSGVMLDMFISGTDFYDPSSSGAACPNTNQLALTNFRYFATNGAASTAGKPGVDDEGYLPIAYGDKITQARKIILGTPYGLGAAEADWANGNALTPGAEMALTFKLSMPEPCVGDFSEGMIYFWGEAI
ncbi:MAG: hypothetical protein ABH840_04675 [Nanoarchaeota archaeon]